MNVRLAAASILLAASLAALAWLLTRGDSPPRALPAPAAGESAAVPPPPEFPLPGSPSAAPEGDESARASDAMRDRLYELLGEVIDGPDVQTRTRNLLAHREALDALLAELGPESVDLLAELLAEKWHFLDRRAIIRRLGEIGTDRAADLLAAHYWTLAAQGQETELNYTIEAIGIVQSPYSFRLLNALIDEKETALHRFRFVEQLGRHQDNVQAVPTFLRIADSKNETYFKTRMRAAWALKQANDPRAAPQVEVLLDSEPDKYVRQALCGTLGDLGDPRSVGRLAAIARTDENHQTRMSAIRALSRIGGDDARAVIEELKESDGHERVRLEATRALEKMDGNG